MYISSYPKINCVQQRGQKINFIHSSFYFKKVEHTNLTGVYSAPRRPFLLILFSLADATLCTAI